MKTFQTLPIDSFISSIEIAVQQKSTVIVVAEPGTGKTTRVPVALSRNGSRWIVLQPRRWAARMSATRIAEEQGFRLGEEVGYQIRFESKQSKNTRILFMTEGVLLRRLHRDPELQDVQGVILDEFHERSLDLDLALSLLKEIQGSLRPDLKVVVMSATLDPAPIEAFMPDTQTFQISGRTFPVKKKYLGEVSVLSAAKTALLENPSGDVLVFLPGSYEIDRAVRELRDHVDDSIEVLPLYASLPDAEQKKVFLTGKKRKIICSTNIAETSLTLPNVKVVIDTGLAKIMRTDPQFGQERLETLRISRASSEQRAGRAGRVSEGTCYRLWTEAEHEQLRLFETPEIHRVHLGQALLFLSEFGIRDFKTFGWYETPKSSMLDFASKELSALEFIKDGSITEAGKQALSLPLPPRFAKLVLVAKAAGIGEFGARITAFLEDRASDQPLNSIEALLRKLNDLRGAALQNARQIYQSGSGQADPPQVFIEDWEFYEDVLIEALRSSVFCHGKVVGRRTVLSKSGPLPKFGLILRSIERTERGVPTILIQSYVELSEEKLLKKAVKKRRCFFDENADRVRGLEGLFFEDLEMGPTTEVPAQNEEATALLSEHVLSDPEGILSRNEGFERWLKRVIFFNRVSDNKIELNWSEWVTMICENKTRMSQVLDAPMVDWIEGMMPSGLKSKFEQWAPATIEVPSGSQIKIDYTEEKPKLSVRLQEIFGWIETPRIAEGRSPLLIELLSPGFKPIQLTQDLKSFWSNAYFEVKKELKARYPKHSWPEDPLTATPQAKGRRQFR